MIKGTWSGSLPHAIAFALGPRFRWSTAIFTFAGNTAANKPAATSPPTLRVFGAATAAATANSATPDA